MHKPPRLEDEDGKEYGQFLTYCRYAGWWCRPYEAVADAHACTPASIATTAHRRHWDIRFETWRDTL